MKKKFMVVSIMEVAVSVEEAGLHTRYSMLEFNEGVFDNKHDAEERLRGMIEEERQNDDEMYFDIKEVYSK